MKFLNKSELVSVCIKHIEQQASVIKKMMDEAQQQSNEYGQPKDRYDSFRTKILRQRDMYAQQYQNLADQTILLQQIPTESVFDKVQFGSIVKTDKSLMFVAAAIGKVVFNGQTVFVISVSAPIFAAMNGLKAGNSFIINQIKQNILEIY